MSRKHTFSQNFLRSPKLALMLVGHTNIKKRDFVVDIGAGSGVFSYALSKKASNVLAIELDNTAFQKLKKNTEKLTNIKIIKADFLKFNLSELPKDYKICANIPFHLSSPIILKITNSNNTPKSAYLILQKQFAQKLISSDRHFTSALGIKIFPFFETRIRKPLRKTDFTPPPAVDTVFFEMKRRESPLIEKIEQKRFEDFIDRMFSTPEYYHKNCLLKFKTKKPSELTGEKWIEMWQNFIKSDRME